MNKSFTLIVGLILAMAFYSCHDEEDEYGTPKKRGYFRIAFPQKEYRSYDSECPFKFDYPVYAAVLKDEDRGSEFCWLNVYYPRYKGTLHLSYKKVEGNADKYMRDSWGLASKHQIKASGINDQVVQNDAEKVYGLVFEIEGNAASPLQFYLTDSTKHFLRGALYFECAPNSDSIAPVSEFIRKDVYKMIESFKWK